MCQRISKREDHASIAIQNQKPSRRSGYSAGHRCPGVWLGANGSEGNQQHYCTGAIRNRISDQWYLIPSEQSFSGDMPPEEERWAQDEITTLNRVLWSQYYSVTFRHPRWLWKTYWSPTTTKSLPLTAFPIRTLVDKAAEVLCGMGNMMFEIVRSPCKKEAGWQYHTAIHLGAQTSQSDWEHVCHWVSLQKDTSRDPGKPVRVHSDLPSHTQRLHPARAVHRIVTHLTMEFIKRHWIRAEQWRGYSELLRLLNGDAELALSVLSKLRAKF